jgi:hypothetical protein
VKVLTSGLLLASNINLNIESDNIECKASSGSSITIEGMALI